MENNFAESNQNVNKPEKSFDLIETILIYLRFWPYFLISVLIAFLACKYYLNHTLSVYETSAKVKIIDDSKNNFNLPSSPVALFSRNKVNLENETEVIKSYKLLEQVCRNLNLNNQYFLVGYFNYIEIWRNRPFELQWMDSSLKMDEKSISIEIEIVEGGFKIRKPETAADDKVRSFNKVEYVDGIPFKLNLQVGTNYKTLQNNKYLISHQPLSSAVLSVKGNLEVVNASKTSDILVISYAGTNIDKSEAVINEVIRQFDVDGLNDKRLVSKRTIDFVNERFKSLESDLDSIENSKASFKQNRDLIFIEGDAASATDGKMKATTEVYATEAQIALAKVLQKSITEDKKLGLLPANIGLESAAINELINTFNDAVFERDRQSVSAGQNNPKIVFLNSKLSSLRDNILLSIKSYVKDLEVSLSQNNSIKRSADNKFAAVPQNEKILRKIERQQNLKETLYVLLLGKREEASINYAITSSSMKVIDYAITDGTPIAPKRSNYYFVSILVGLFIPFIVVFLFLALDDKIHTKEDVIKIIRDKNIAAELPHIPTDQRLTGNNDRTVLGEAFRILRTNLSYIFPTKIEGLGQTILVTSTIKGEGKTFVSLNLAVSYSLIDKKVLLIGTDLRNPQLHTYLNIDKNERGLQDYLIDAKYDWRNSIMKNQVKDSGNLDIIISGSIPTSPAELLSNGRLGKLIDEARKEYDIIILDTAPTLLVTDTLIISQLVETSLYVVRSDFTPKNILEFSVNLSERGKIVNMAYVINNVGSNYKGYSYKYGYDYSYNYGYGYGYDMKNNVKKKSLFRRIFAVFLDKKSSFKP